jgi:hypothetical protein
MIIIDLTSFRLDFIFVSVLNSFSFPKYSLKQKTKNIMRIDKFI